MLRIKPTAAGWEARMLCTYALCRPPPPKMQQFVAELQFFFCWSRISTSFFWQQKTFSTFQSFLSRSHFENEKKKLLFEQFRFKKESNKDLRSVSNESLWLSLSRCFYWNGGSRFVRNERDREKLLKLAEKSKSFFLTADVFWPMDVWRSSLWFDWLLLAQASKNEDNN